MGDTARRLEHLEARVDGLVDAVVELSRDHVAQVDELREAAEASVPAFATSLTLAADLLAMHDEEAINLDNWPAAQAFVIQQVAAVRVPRPRIQMMRIP